MTRNAKSVGITAFSLAAFLFLAVAISFAQEPNRTEVSPPLRPQATPTQKLRQLPMTTRVKHAATKAGIKTCLGRIDQITGFLASDGEAGAIAFFPPAESDKHLSSVSLGIEMNDGQTAYASESFAPNKAGGCDGMYETVVYWEDACTNVAQRKFASFKLYGAIGNDIIVMDGGPGVRVFLMPAGSGCIAIKKEVLN